MPKDKIKKVIENKDVYFEGLSFFIGVFMLIILTKLGKVGVGLNLFFKLIFGDWYWLLLVMTLFISFRFTLYQKKISFKSVRLNGFFLFFLSIMLLSHSSIYTYSKNFDNNELVGCFNLYMYYLEAPNGAYMVGGGLLGALIFQILAFCVGKLGVILISILLLIFSTFFMTGNSIFSFKKILKGGIKNLKFGYSGMLNYLSNIELTKNKISINSLSDIDLSMNHTIQEKISNDNRQIIEDVFKKVEIDLIFKKIEIGYSTTRYIFEEIDGLNTNTVSDKLNAVFDVGVVVYNNNNLIIEVNNRFKELLTLKRLLMVSNVNLPIGLEIDQSIIEFDLDKNKHLLISGGYESGIRTFIRSFIVTMILRRIPFDLALIDTKEEFYELNNYNLFGGYTNTYDNIDKTLNILTNECEKRLELSSYLGANNFNDTNNKISEKNQNIDILKRLIIIINGYELLYKNNQNIEQKIHYLASLGDKCGIHLFVINRVGKILSPLLKNSLITKVLFKCYSIPQSLEMIDSENGLNLSKNGDFLLIHETTIKRGQAPYISNEDYIKIIKRN